MIAAGAAAPGAAHQAESRAPKELKITGVEVTVGNPDQEPMWNFVPVQIVTNQPGLNGWGEATGTGGGPGVWRGGASRVRWPGRPCTSSWGEGPDGTADVAQHGRPGFSRRWVLSAKPVYANGAVTIHDKPGLGIQANEAAARKRPYIRRLRRTIGRREDTPGPY